MVSLPCTSIESTEESPKHVRAVLKEKVKCIWHIKLFVLITSCPSLSSTREPAMEVVEGSGGDITSFLKTQQGNIDTHLLDGMGASYYAASMFRMLLSWTRSPEASTSPRWTRTSQGLLLARRTRQATGVSSPQRRRLPISQLCPTRR